MANLDKTLLALENKLDRMEKMGENTVIKNYKNTLDDLRISLSKLYGKYEIDGQLKMEVMQKYNRIDKLDKQVHEKVMDLYSSNSKLIRGTLKGITKETYKNTIDAVEKVTGKKIKGIMKDLPVTKVVNEDMAGLNWTTRLQKHRNDLIYEVQKEIKQGLANGETYSVMTERLKKSIGIDTSTVNTIVRTESHRVKSQAKEDSFEKIEKAGVKFKKKWVSSRDERVRSSHSEMDGVIIDRDEAFILPSGIETMQPGLSGEASEDINCRCKVILVLEE